MEGGESLKRQKGRINKGDGGRGFGWRGGGAIGGLPLPLPNATGQPLPRWDYHTLPAAVPQRLPFPALRCLVSADQLWLRVPGFR